MRLLSEPPAEPERIRFADRRAFASDLKVRADAYFNGPGRALSRRDVPLMYLKTLSILVWFVGSWALLVFVARTGLQATLFAVSLGWSIAAIGMGVQHDANHGAYSKKPWVNRAFGFTLDVMGVCSYIWRQKHNVIHHTFTNVEGVDFDLDFGIIARLTPEQRRRPWHRYQHLYIWFLYGFLLPKWVFVDDFTILRTKRMGPHKLPPMDPVEIALFIGWKVFFVAWAIVIPALLHPLWVVLVFHMIAVFTLGVTLSTVFQLAHCVGEADFPEPAPSGERMSCEWAVHQVATTVDFAPKNPLLTWFLGGLSFQVEHHLFPKVCHLHYPALAQIVEEVAEIHGVRYRKNLTLSGAIASHFRHLRKLGRPDVAPVVQEPTAASA